MVRASEEELAADASDPLETLQRSGSDPEFWRSLCPWLHVGDPELHRLAKQAVFPFAEGDETLAERADELAGDLLEQGYFEVPSGELQWAVDIEAVARGVAALVARGLPPGFILAFDEPWVLAAQLEQLVRVTTGGNELLLDWSTFYVKAGSRSPSDGGEAPPAGWPPHRDRGTEAAAKQGFRADGTARYATFWLALTDATPASSCLMVVPKAHDPGYAAGDGGKNPLSAVFSTPEAFQHIRALPTAAGGLVAFTHRLLHWGSAADRRAPAPRIAIAFAASDPTYERPYLPRSVLPLPPLGVRLSLVAGLALMYAQNEQIITSERRLDLLWRLFSASASHFDGAFRALLGAQREALQRTLSRRELQDNGVEHNDKEDD